MENYVRRLYYYTADTRDPAQSEVGFWVQALAEGDVTPAVLGQSFIFTTDKANSYTDAQAFYTMASYARCHHRQRRRLPALFCRGRCHASLQAAV